MEANLDQIEESGVIHVQWANIPGEMVNPQLERRYVVGVQTMVARMHLAKGCVVPLHSHHNEQVSYIEAGALLFTIDGKEILVTAGELICLPPNVPHTAVAMEDTIDIDFFVPPREDWISKHDLYLR